MEISELVLSLKNAKRRNPLAYQIIGAVSGIGEKRISNIATGKVQPSTSEAMLLTVYAQA